MLHMLHRLVQDKFEEYKMQRTKKHSSEYEKLKFLQNNFTLKLIGMKNIGNQWIKRYA